ncbi:MAG: DNA topoisomerase IB [Frankiales bacterium]|nr:DNA topoisomerase IB [Frankiales bacterium]
MPADRRTTRPTGLRRSSPDDPGIRRRRRGTGFSYRDDVTGWAPSATTRERIRGLAIPPAWRDVWICRDPSGHLQATGVDDAGRVQYLYHPEWRRRRDTAKFERMERFAARLPAARRRVARHLRDAGPTRRRALAAAFRILDRGCIRVGSEQYARDGGGIGAATLRRTDVALDGDRVRLAFTGKSGVAQEVELRDRRLAAALRPMLERGGRRRTGRLLAYEDDDEWHGLRSSDINDYVHDTVGEGFSAKDFRTWHATVAARDALVRHEAPASARERARGRREAAEAAAAELGDTPAVALRAYVDPRVIEDFERGDLEDARAGEGPALDGLAGG